MTAGIECERRGKFELIAQFETTFHAVSGFLTACLPRREKFRYTFDNIAGVIERFTEVIGFDGSRPMSLTMARQQASDSRSATPADHRYHFAERQRLPGRP